MLDTLKCWKKPSRPIEELAKETVIDEHVIPLQELLARFNVDPALGLSHDEALRRLERDGPNKLTPVKRISSFTMFFKQMVQSTAVLLWVATILCLMAYVTSLLQGDDRHEYLYLAIALALVEFISATFGFLQERKSSKIMESFAKMIPQYAVVRRDGLDITISTEELCLGDIVKVKAGDRIPADLRCIEIKGFKVDNSPLTGESVPEALKVKCSSENPVEAGNIAFFSTYAVEGNAVGIVIHIGDHTMMGRIAALADVIEARPTPIRQESDHFMNIITIVSVVQGLILMGLSMLIGYPWLDAIVFLVGIIVANVPEGLMVTVSICLTLAARRMAEENCLIKNLEAVETLGSTSVICTDKTGTLTQNRMTVAHLWADMETVTVETSEHHLYEELTAVPETWRVLAKVAVLCNNARFADTDDRDDIPIVRQKIIGNASEAALLRWVEMTFGDAEKIRTAHERVYEVPFTSDIKYHLCIHKANRKDSHYLLVMKGAPEVVVEACSTVLVWEEERPLDDAFREEFMKIHTKLGNLGERILGFCDYYLPHFQYPAEYPFNSDDINFPLNGFRFLGLVSILDPPRANVPSAVQQCRLAGIKVVMVTGDHPVTGKAIARKVGIISEDGETVEDIAERLQVPVSEVDPTKASSVVIQGNDLAQMTSDDLTRVIVQYEEIVFARTSPQQKLMIVEGFQELGSIVAVTGDGVNDAPALKKADIGIAMGITGTEVSKEAADLILMNDNFASIVRGVEEGRLIFENLKKSILYTLTSKISEVGPFVFFIIGRAPLPLGTITILCIDLGTDMLPAISLAYEEAESDMMKQKPRDPSKDKLANSRLLNLAYWQLGVIQALAGFYAYFVVMAENGFLPERLLGIHQRWYSKSVNDLEDSYGQEWNYQARMDLEYTCHSAFFVSIVILQWATLITSKTRRYSVFSQGMRNMILNFSLVFETALAAFLVYTPGMNYAVHIYPLKTLWWFCAFPFFFLTMLYSELRHWLLRRYPGGWFERETCY